MGRALRWVTAAAAILAGLLWWVDQSLGPATAKGFDFSEAEFGTRFRRSLSSLEASPMVENGCQEAAGRACSLKGGTVGVMLSSTPGTRVVDGWTVIFGKGSQPLDLMAAVVASVQVAEPTASKRASGDALMAMNRAMQRRGKEELRIGRTRFAFSYYDQLGFMMFVSRD